jgi:serine/threonine-protein kinase
MPMTGETLSVDQLSQLLFNLNLVEQRHLDRVRSSLGTKEPTVEEFRNQLLRENLVTNFQFDRLMEGRRTGFFYGAYKALYIVGAGTFARVFRAVHTSTGDVKAVKVLRRRFTEDMTATDQFLREAAMVKPLRHPNIVPVYDVERTRDATYMVMEFVEGRNLRDFLKVRGVFSVEEALRFTLDVATGLDYAFQRGVVHRDIKLSNVLVSSAGRGMLVDFGLAAMEMKTGKEKDDSMSNPRSVDYVGLERVSGVPKHDRRSDIYFVGVMLYHMLTGDSPIVETRDRLQRLSASRFQKVTPLVDLVPDLPQRVAAVIGKAMELDASKRYQTPGDLRRDVANLMELCKANSLGPTLGQMAAQPEGAAAVAAPRIDFDAEREGEDATVMLVESDVSVQDAVREELKKRGYRVLVISDPSRAAARIEDLNFPLDAMIIGSSGLGRLAFESFTDFARKEETAATPLLLLVDRQFKDLLSQMPGAPHRKALALPLNAGSLRKTLHDLIRTRREKDREEA